MRITKAQVRNFRLLESAVVYLDAEATMVVGRNNSGKTSFVEVFRKFFGADSGRFSCDDLSLLSHARMQQALDAYEAAQAARAVGDDVEAVSQEDVCREALPAIELTLTVEYEDVDDLAPLAPFIMDLDPSRRDGDRPGYT